MKQNNIFFRYFSPVATQQKLYAAALVALLSSSAYEAEEDNKATKAAA